MEPIAIIGYSFKFPQGIEDDSSLWDMLANSRNMMTPWPRSRTNLDAFYHPNSKSSNVLYSKGAHFLREDPAVFDAPFFSITSKEAASMDTQQRWLLETTYRAFENAGIPAEKVAGTNTGVFAASMADDYFRMVAKDPDEAPTNVATGTPLSMLANRLSWYFDLQGPSIQLNTACSSSIIAMDLACQSLRSGQSSMAVVTGSNVLLNAEVSIYLSNMNFLSPDSVCYSFDHRANGYGRGEGYIVIVLKRLSDAVRDNDMIRAVIRATGSNQDGRTPGITQPSVSAQESLIRQVYNSCQLDFGLTRYVEAHGTGTQLGDYTEMSALGRVFKTSRSPAEPLYVGSVKANIGHLEAGSGLAGVIKSIAILEKGIIPPNALFDKMNPKINAKKLNIQARPVPTSCIPWPTKGLRRVSVDSFGFGGSNGHVILDDAYHTLEAFSLQGFSRMWSSVDSHSQTNPKQNEVNTGQNDIAPTHGNAMNGSKKSKSAMAPNSLPHYRILIWSANDQSALRRMLRNYGTYYKNHVASSEAQLDQLAYTLSARRSSMNWRTFMVVDSATLPDDTHFSNCELVRSSREMGLVLIFTGQGAQYHRMGMDLLQYPVFASVVQESNLIFQELGAEWSLIDQFENQENINRPEFSQPLCTVLQIGLVELLKSWNIIPAAVVGHSSGEIAAAYTIGALSLKSACKVAYHRGRLTGALALATSKPGAMLAANIPEAEIPKYLKRFGENARVSIACINSPFNVTLSGDESDINSLKEAFEAEDIFARKLNTGVAYHSVAMQDISEDYLSCMGDLGYENSLGNAILMISTVTGERIYPHTLRNSQYWVDNMISPVRFVDALSYLTLAASKHDGLKPVYNFLEVGPHSALSRPLKDTLGSIRNAKSFQYMSLLSRFELPVRTVLNVIGRLFSSGYSVNILAANQQDSGSRTYPPLVDAPEYPFDHSQTYWHETRLSEQWRLRPLASPTLLGAPTTDWNPIEPRWRKIIRITEMPWVADHVIEETIFFPAAGTLLMALEAVKQMADKNKVLLGYNVKEATFLNPIVIREEGSTEVITQLKPLQQTYEKAMSRFEVQVFMRTDATWNTCFKSTISLQYREIAAEVDGGLEWQVAAQAMKHDYDQAAQSCTNSISHTDFYAWHHAQGLKYGPGFSLARDIYWDGRELSIACVDVKPLDRSFDGIVHPAVLDSVSQVSYTGPSNGMTEKLPTTIPHKIRDAWVAATGWQHPDTSQIRMLAKSKAKPNKRGATASLTLLADDGSPLFRIKHLEMLPVVGGKPESSARINLLHTIEWKPQLSSMNPHQLAKYCGVEALNKDETYMVDFMIRVEKVLLSIIQLNIDQLLETNWSTAPQHMKKYVQWLKTQLNKSPDRIGNTASLDDLVQELDILASENPGWGMIMDIARNLVSIVQGETNVLELLFTSTLAYDFYDEFIERRFNDKVKTYLHLLAHQNPEQKILEVGAGTGATSRRILSTLNEIEDSTGGLAFSEYIYTDISAGFFSKAEDSFAEYKERMKYKTLNLEHDPGSQGFEKQSFDVIVADNVLHATKNIGAALQSLRYLLRPGGHIIIHEITTHDSLVMGFGFGVLPGWWEAEEDSRNWCPTISATEWDALLRANEFSGTDLVINDYGAKEAHIASFMLSTVLTAKPAEEDTRTLLVTSNDEHQSSMASLLANLLCSLGFQATIINIAQLEDQNWGSIDFVVFIAEMSGSMLYLVSEMSFRHLQTLVSRSKNLLWVTASFNRCDNTQPTEPYSALKDGLLRTLRSEFNTKRIISLSFEGVTECMTECIHHIAAIFRSAFVDHATELEYVVRGAQVFTGRLVELKEVNQELNAAVFPEMKVEPWLPGPPLKLTTASRGSLEALQFVEDKDNYKSLASGNIEIEAKTWGINFRDLFTALGRLDDEDEFGSDCAGIVTRVGSQVQSIQPGDRVCLGTSGSMRMYPRAVDERSVVRIPDMVSFEQACAILNPAMTALQSLINVANLQKGEKVLIHAASGATGQLAIQVAQMVGAEIFATVGYDFKKQFLIDTYNIDADHIFYSRDLTFSSGIMRVTANYGVDVVLNSLVGEGLRTSWECMAPYGRFIEIGKADIYANAVLPMQSFAANVSFSAVDLNHINIYRKDLAKTLLVKVMELVANGTLRAPMPINSFAQDKIEEALRFLQSGKNIGRIVINVNPSTMVKKHLLRYKSWVLDSNATYLVAGGLGGIGRSIIQWMVSKGGRNFLVPSRSGPSSVAASKLLEHVRDHGGTIITPLCDVSDTKSLSQVLDSCSTKLPPIRGCINASMTLQDSVFDNMTHDQWNLAIRSKVQTSWNLHTLLPKELDFFILLSSLSGVIGNVSQSNYAAGCTFQDSLAAYRANLGHKALSIDLGAMRTVGIIAETEKLRNTFKGLMSYRQVEEVELLAFLNICCNPAFTVPAPSMVTQVMVGLATPADLLARGLEPVETMNRPLFAYFSRLQGVNQYGNSAHTLNLGVEFRQAKTQEARRDTVIKALTKKLAGALSMQPEDISSENPVHSYGVDSLVAMELRNWIGREFAADLPVFEISGSRTIYSIVELILQVTQIILK